MNEERMTAFQKQVNDYRTHYKFKYNVDLDDDIIYILLRINKAEVGLKEEIKKIPKLTYRNGWDCFLHGLGKTFFPSLVLIIALLIYLVYFLN